MNRLAMNAVQQGNESDPDHALLTASTPGATPAKMRVLSGAAQVNVSPPA
jgi:hypothetical protein